MLRWHQGLEPHRDAVEAPDPRPSVPRARSLIRTLPARRDTTAPRDPTALSSGGDWRPERERERYGFGGAEADRTGSSTRSAATAGAILTS